MDQNGAKRYSAALFEVAKQSDKAEKYLEQLKEIIVVFNSNHELIDILNHPNLQYEQKKSVVDKLFRDRIDNGLVGLLYTLIQHNKINELLNINLHYRDIVFAHKGIKIAYVTTAVKMDSFEKIMLKVRLARMYNCDVEIENKVDASIIGGVLLKIGDEVIDGTVKGNFEKMKKELLSNSVR